ncbi:MAG: hypothetical protein QOF83_2885 [Solirubrobacteraceae bacterium]|jgi:hypothetical protein|nr:hypothetical protein [Solirubrobacteraceae bacterium]
MLDLVAGGQRPPRPMPADTWRGYYAAYRERGFPVGAEVPDRVG